jgi:alkanesulfonate monooxygenase SsuD/methylene tetrahydromethanopterin reductase-like flavin-dependent oxidoreductase (luciferase family)
VPKPYQKPHPPLWVACNRREKIVDAAHRGMGALNFSFGVKPELARRYADAYYKAFTERIDPIGLAPNPNLAVVTGFNCTNSALEAERAFTAMKFFMHAINYYFEPGRKMPERLDIAASFGDGRGVSGVDDNDPASLGIFGDPAHVERSLRAYEDSGVDQVILVAQAGGYAHDQIMASLELFGREVLPAFKDRDRQASPRKAERLAAAGVV